MTKFLTDHDILRKRIYDQAGIERPVPNHMYELSLIEAEQWSQTFERRIRNRLLMGAYRYGKMNEVGKPNYNCADSAIKRLKRYKQDGNLEWIADVAALLFIEWKEGQHPKRHWNSIDDTNLHAQPTKKGD